MISLVSSGGVGVRSPLSYGCSSCLDEIYPRKLKETVTKYIDLLQVRRLRPFHANIGKRLVKSPKVYVRDSGLLHALPGIKDYNALAGHPVVGASREGFLIENLLSVVRDRTLASFYRTSAGAEVDLVLGFPGLTETWVIEIRRGLSAKPTKGFYNAVEDIQPDKTFIVYAGDERYPVSEGVEAISVPEMARMFLEKAGA